MLAKGTGAGNKSLMLLSKKRTVSNAVSKNGTETVKSRHAMPLDLDSLFAGQVNYQYQPPKVEYDQRDAETMNSPRNKGPMLPSIE